MPQLQKVEAIYENGVLRPLEPLEGFSEHCKVNIMVEYGEMLPHPLARLVDILSDEGAQELRHIIENLERELTTLKKLIETSEETQKIKNEERIQKLRKQLIDEGWDEELVQLVGTVPLRIDNYKEEIRNVVYERAQRKL
jgi:predicted DNA-binding antitoxin AbrB/MazE fold protein